MGHRGVPSRWTANRQRRLLASLCLAALLPGCAALGKALSVTKTDNPVMQPPPLRTTLEEQAAAGQLASTDANESPIQTVSGSTAAGTDDTEVFNATVIARVNGAPVFAAEVLDIYADYLRTAREKLPPEDYEELRDTMIRRDLRSHIERRLLVERMRSKLKPDQIKTLEQYIDHKFEEEMVPKLKKQLEVSTRTELELALNERNTSLQTVHDNFATERIAMEFVFSSLERPPAPTRPDIVAYYQQHLDDYAVPARVKWQQIQISIDRRTSKTDAEAKLAEAQKELAGGVPFDKVAQKYSDGPTASTGGEWDWTRSGSLADTELETKLFELPIGQISEVHETRDAFQIVRVIDRDAEGRKPLAEVQDEIAEKIRKDRERDLPKKFVENLFQDAVIETEYDYLQPTPA